jgi:hypothetical protein
MTMETKAKFRQLENVNVNVIIKGYNRKLDCLEQIDARFFTESEKQQLIKLTEKFLKKRAKKLIRKGDRKINANRNS